MYVANLNKASDRLFIMHPHVAKNSNFMSKPQKCFNNLLLNIVLITSSTIHQACMICSETNQDL